jgi:SAP domain
MTLWARSDLMSVSVPVTSGGCGQTHSRPVRKGVPDRDFKLDCPGCEGFLKGSGRMILKTTPPDKENGIPSTQERVADCDPCWGATPESVPDTPDEKQYTSRRNKLGAEQLEWVRALAAARQAGIEIPEMAMEMLSRRLPGIVQGSVVRNEVTASQYSLDDLSQAKLQQMCRDQGLPATGTRAKLIERLS